MADVKISQLPTGGTLDGTEIVPIVQGGASKKITTAAIAALAADNSTPGADGHNGWTPVPAIVSDGSRRVQQVSDWTGGSGTKPATGQYVGASGFTSVLADAVDVRGAAGATGATGATGPQGPSGAGGAASSIGYTTAIPFTGQTIIAPHTIATDTVFTKVTAGAVAGATATLELTADDRYIVDFSAFKLLGTGFYDSTTGAVTLCMFGYDGTNYTVAFAPVVTLAAPVRLNAPTSFAHGTPTDVGSPFTWTDTNTTPPESGYEIQIADAADTTYASVRKQLLPLANATSFAASTGLAASSNYRARIRAVGDGVSTFNSGWSTEVTFTTAATNTNTLNFGLDAYWKFDESTGATVAADATSNHHDLTKVGSAPFSAGKIGNCAACYHPSGMYFKNTSLLNNTTTFSVNAWLKISATTGLHRCIGRANEGANKYEWEIYANSGNIYAIVSADGITTTSCVLKAGYSASTWGMVTLTVDCTTGAAVIKTFFNALLTDSKTIAGASAVFQDVTNEFRVGNIMDNDGVTDIFVDEISLYSKALNQSEITDDYNSGAGKQYPF